MILGSTRPGPMPRKQVDALIRKAQAGSEEAKVALLEQYNSLLWRLVRKVPTPHEDEDDLIQMARIAFLEVLDRFIVGKSQLMTYAYRYVLGRLRSHRVRSRLVKIPGSGWMGRKASEELKAATKIAMRPSTSLEGSAKGGMTIGDKLVDFRGQEDEALAERQQRVDQFMAMIDRLPPRQAEVMRRRAQGETLKQIAESMGVVRERVRQIQIDATEAIRRTSEGMPAKQRKLPRQRWSVDDMEFVARCLADGWPIDRIAARLGRTYWSVAAISIGWGDCSFAEAVTLEAVFSIGRPATIMEIVTARKAEGARRGWPVTGGERTVGEILLSLRRQGLLETSRAGNGGGNQRKLYWFSSAIAQPVCHRRLVKSA